MIAAVKGQTAALFHFGGFTLDLQRSGLYRDGKRIHLTSKPLETLAYLVRNRDRVVEKRELLESVWKGTFVTEDTLVHAVMEIRVALADDKEDPRFIKTIPRRGYRFVATVSLELPHQEGNMKPLTSLLISADERDVGKPTLLDRFKSPNRLTLIVLAVLIIALGVVAFWVKKLLPQIPTNFQSQIPFQRAKFAKLTSNGNITDAVIFPDGRYVIYALRIEGEESLWLKQVATSSTVQISEPGKITHQGLTISPEGNYLYYVGFDWKRNAALYRMPVLGGAAARLFEDIDGAISFSPDGRQFAFFRGYPQNGESAVMVANSDVTAERKLVVLKRPYFFPTRRVAPAWSPDGKIIACPTGKTGSTQRNMTVTAVSIADGGSRPMTADQWWEIGQVAWLRDGSGLVFNAKEKASSPFQIWHLSYPEGKSHQITNDLNDYLGLSLTADSTSLVTLQSQTHSNVWIATDGSEKRARQITFSNLDGATGLSWTPDGRIVYVSRVSGNQDIWIMGQDGRSQTQLTVEAGDNNWPSVSPNGRYIVFMSNRTGANHIWRMNIDGTNPKQLTYGVDERWPDCSPDGQWVVYASSDGVLKLFRVSVEGGNPVQLTAKEATRPVVSPDGRLLAAGYFDDPAGMKTVIYPFQGGAPLKILDIWSFHFRWAPNGRSLSYVDGSTVANIMNYPIEGGSPNRLTNFKVGGISEFDWSRTGQLTYSRSTTTADVVLLTDRVRR